jgi:NAD(P)-dependent dehydrogenase (short-subunit alcohol dehydrogenase family)
MDKTAIVWGAAGGIGRALVQQLCDEDWKTIAIARKASDLASMTPHVIESDVSDPHQVQAAVYAAAMEVDSVDLWIYAVGDILSARVADLDFESWNRILVANLTGAFLCTHHSRPLLAEDAHLFFLGAVSERLRLPGLSAYAAAKAGLEAFGETLRKEERKKRVTVVRPVAAVTPLWDKVPMRVPADAPAPAKVAARILKAYDEKHKGILDLTG